MSQKLLKILLIFPILLLLVVAATVPMLAAPPGQGGDGPCEDDHIVELDDWLSKVADKYFGDVLAYPIIFTATNLAALDDPSYATLEDADHIQVGQKLCIPSADEAVRLVEEWSGLIRDPGGGAECVQIETQHKSTDTKEPPVTAVVDNETFISDEIIVTGLADDVRRVLAEFKESPILDVGDLEIIASIELSQLPPPGGDPPTASITPTGGMTLTTNLVKISKSRILGEPAVTRVMQEGYEIVRRLAQGENPTAGVYFDPNYVTGLGWDPGGSPLGGLQSSQAGQDAFNGQWALGTEYGIHLMGDNGRTFDGLGAGTQIFVLDASMFYQPGSWEFGPTRWDGPPTGPTATLRLCVSHPRPTKPLQSPGSYKNVNHHGVFVAGLAHAVAPDSDIHLVRVLNSRGNGTLFGLVDALAGVITATEQANGGLKPMNRTVIHMSLGFESAGEKELELETGDMDRLLETIQSIIKTSSPEVADILGRMSCEGGEDELPVPALEQVLALAHSKGAVIVAAAGNDSGGSGLNGPKPAQRPACYPAPYVIGVASSDQRLERSCFSNLGDIAAPGGGQDTGGEPSQCTSEAFRTKITECTSTEALDCPYSVISYSPPATTTGYGFWVGTSFAAPQVSGLAALLLEQGVPVTRTFDGMINTTTSVADPELRGGIINIEQAMAPFN